MPRILTTVQAAEELGFDRKTVARLCESGKLVGAYRSGMGAHWRIPFEAVEAFRSGNRPVVRIRKPLSDAGSGQSGQEVY